MITAISMNLPNMSRFGLRIGQSNHAVKRFLPVMVTGVKVVPKLALRLHGFGQVATFYSSPPRIDLIIVIIKHDPNDS